MWRNHYEDLFNCNTNEMVTTVDTFGTVCSHVGINVTLSKVLQIVKDLPNGISSGLDGLNGESMKHAHPLLCLLLSICSTSMFKQCYMLQSMINLVIIPIIKNKSGNFTDKNNYRPIILSSIISKVFEHIIIICLEEYLRTNDNQFGFKSGYSTDLCFYALTEYFKSCSTSVYVAFLDASKAFDKINHWTVFRKLIERYVSLYLVVMLCYWYQHQEMTVKWGHCISNGNSFNVTNGVCQGGDLSPQLFNVYIDGLSDILNKSTICGSLDGKRINHLLYADDLCIVSLSSAGLQQLVSICDQYCASHSLTFNVHKSVCMFFKSKMNKLCDNLSVGLSGMTLCMKQNI